MAKADVLGLVTEFCLGLASGDEASRYYDEIVREIGLSEVLTGVDVQAIATDEPEHTNQADTIRILELHTGDYGRLDRTDQQSVESFRATWRVGSGSPNAFIQSNINEDTLRLIPVPSKPDTLSTIRTEYREDVPVWLELPIAFEIMSREFFRESDHQDLTLAIAAAGAATILFDLLGMEVISAAIRQSAVSG